MAEITGIISRIKYRNHKTGYTEFSVRKDNEIFFCSSIMQPLSLKTPVKITGDIEMENNKKIVKNCKVKCFSDSIEYTIPFLCSFSSAFRVGVSEAQSITSKIGPDIFQYIRENDIEEDSILTNKDKQILRQIKYYTVFEDLYDYIISINGNYHNASIINNLYGINSLKFINDNPYLMCYGDIDFSICDEIAYKKQIEMCDERRCKALTHKALTMIYQSGNTKAFFSEVYNAARRIEGDNYYITHPLFILEALTDELYQLEETNNGLNCYFSEMYKHEVNIATNIKRLTTSSKNLRCKEAVSIEEIEKICNVKYSQEQKEAFKITETSGVKVITGGPGTGKTTLLNGIITKIKKEHPSFSFALCAPTGRAAKRMKESTGMEAFTIHHLLKLQPFNNIPSSEKIEANVCIVDESSMMDTELFSKLLSSISNGTLLIIIGDIDQLPSIAPGNVLRDLIESNVIETYRLKTIFRQEKEDSLIINNSHKVINGDKLLDTDQNFKIKRFDSEDDIIVYLEKAAKSLYQAKTDFSIFSPTKKRKFKTSVVNLNNLLQKAKINSNNFENNIFYGDYAFSVGDKVIFTRNNYSTGYYNGQEGIITNIQNNINEFFINVKTEDGNITIDKNDIEDLDLAYALTAHKSQGGECDNAIIVIPKNPISMLKRQLLYVEITRAKKNVLILSEKDALEQCISIKGEFVRNTGLKEKLIL